MNNRGVLYLEKGEYQKAVEDLTLALKHGELAGKIYTNRGLAYAGMGDRVRAMEDYRRAFSARPLDGRSFVFMAEALEAAGDVEKAIKMYQLALGVAPDPQSTSALEKKIAALERKGSAGSQASHQVKSQTDTRRVAKPAESPVPTKPTETPQSANRTHASEATKAAPAQVTAATVESLAALDELARKRAIEKLPEEAATLYVQGYRFAKDSHFNKALVRYEEALQLAKRNKNQYGVAWTLLEIARAYSRIGENPRALSALERALTIFEKLNASDEIVLTLAQLAQVSQAIGLKDKTESYTVRLRQKVAAGGYAKLLTQPTEPRPTAAPSPPTGRTQVAAKETEPERKPSHPSAAPPQAASAQLKRPGPAPRQEVARAEKPTPVAVGSPKADPKPVAVVAVPQPAKGLQRQTFALKEPPGDKKGKRSVESLLAELAQLRAAGEEIRMIEVLEQIAEAYASKKNDR